MENEGDKRKRIWGMYGDDTWTDGKMGKNTPRRGIGGHYTAQIRAGAKKETDGAGVRNDFKREMVGEMATEMVVEFFRAFAFNAGITLHLKVLYGENDHHKIEALFKAFGRALKEAKYVNEENGLPSTKGKL